MLFSSTLRRLAQVKEATYADFSGQMHCERNAMACHGRPSPIYQRSSRAEFQIRNHQSRTPFQMDLNRCIRILKFKRGSFVLPLYFVRNVEILVLLKNMVN